MLKAKLDNKIYELPLGDIYRDRFTAYISGDLLDCDYLISERQYNAINLLFGFVANGLTIMGTEGYPPELLPEKQEILSRMSQVDHLQKYFAKQGQVDKSIELICKLLKVMLEHHEKLVHPNKEKVI